MSRGSSPNGDSACVQMHIQLPYFSVIARKRLLGAAVVKWRQFLLCSRPRYDKGLPRTL